MINHFLIEKADRLSVFGQTFHTFFPANGQTHQANKYKSQNQEIGQAFEPRRGSTLLEQSSYFAGRFKKVSDAFTSDLSLDSLKIRRYAPIYIYII